MELTLLKQVALALALGTLIGMEREFSQSHEGHPYFVGARTFALLSLLGALSGVLARQYSPFILLGAWLTVGAILAISYFIVARQTGDSGITTEIAALLTFLIGVLIAFDQLLSASIVAIAVVTMLSLKPSFKALAGKLSREDIYATIKFSIITVVILPFLPNETIGPLEVLNPREVWLLVVLVSAISFSGYLLFRFVGSRRSIPIIGLIGGVASSTAVTVSFSQRSKSSPALAPALAVGVLLASTAMFPRVLVIISFVDSSLVVPLLIPFAAMTTAGLVAIFALRHMRPAEEPTQEVVLANPFSIVPALKFAALFILILFVSKAALMFAGNQGLYYTAGIAGMSEVDAIAISTARLGNQGVVPRVAVIAITLAAMANTFMKACIAAFFGTRPLAWRVALAFLVVIIAGAIALLVV